MNSKRLLLLTAAFLFLVAPAWGQGTLFVEGSNVGIGVQTPAEVLDINRTTGSAIVQVATDGSASTGNQAGFRFSTDAGVKRWDIRIGGVGNLIYNYNGGAVESTYQTNGNLTILGTLSEGSSRTIKHGFEPVNSEDILNKVMSLPLTTWSYNSSPETRHVGPMAEDFYATFGVGTEPTKISTIDRDGVALAAIQGLKEEKDAEISALRDENARLQAELDQLKALVEGLSAARK